MAGGGGGGGLWTTAHQQQQRALAADANLRQRRGNTIQTLPTPGNSLMQQGPGPGGQSADWDGGGAVGHIGSPSTRGRRDRNFLLDEQQLRLREHPEHQLLVNLPRGGDFPRDISREVFAGGLRLRDSRDEIVSNELLKAAMRNHVIRLDDVARVEIPRAYQQRPAVAAPQQQLLNPVTRNLSDRFGYEENGHAELIARYGDRASFRNLERAHDAIGRGFLSDKLSRKRAREEEAADLDRERLIRRRKPSGITPSSPIANHSPQSGFRQLKESTHEIRRHKASKYGELEAKEMDHVQFNHRSRELSQHKAKYWHQQLRTEEHEYKANGQKQMGRNPEFQQQKLAKYWQQLHPQNNDHDAKEQQKELYQEIQQRKARYWKLQTEEDEHEEGQVTPPSPTISYTILQQQHGIESKSPLLNQEQDLVAVSSRIEATPKVDVNVTDSRNHSSSAYSSEALEFLPNARPQLCSSRSPKAREHGFREGDELKPLVRSREQCVLNRELPSSFARFTNNERTTPWLERVKSGFESNSILASDVVDMRSGREGITEPQNRTCALHSKSAGRLYNDGPLPKHQHQILDTSRIERDLRSQNCFRELRDGRAGGARHDSLLPDRQAKVPSGRAESTLKRKITSNVTGTPKDSRLIGEMTISLQKHGQRIVKVEDYKFRDTTHSRVASLATNKDHRLLSQRGGSFRCGSDHPFPVSSGRDRFNRKKFEGRSPAATREKMLRSHSSPRQQYTEKPTSQDRLPPFSQLVKDELIARTEKFDSEPHRHQSIFSRLVGLRPETNSTRIPAEVKRKDTSLLPAHDKASLPSSSRNSPNVLVETFARNDVQVNPWEFPGFQTSTRSWSTICQESDGSGLKNSNRKNSIAEPIPISQEVPCEGRNKSSQKVRPQEISPGDESAMKPRLQLVVSRPSHHSQKVIFPLEQSVEGLSEELRLVERPIVTNADYLIPLEEGVALLPGDSGGSACFLPSEMGAAEVSDQLPGSGLAVLPKVIATGHRKDQILKRSVLDPENAVHGSSSLPVEVVISVETINQEKGERGFSFLSTNGFRTQESPSPNAQAQRVGSTLSLADCDPLLEKPALGGKQHMSKGKPSEVASENIESVGKGSTFVGSCSPTDIAAPKSSVDAVDIEHPNPRPELEIPSSLEYFECIEGVRNTMVLELHSDEDTQNGLSVVPWSSCVLSNPKEVRLFGANLNAHMGERIDLTPEALGSLDQYVGKSFVLPSEHQEQQCVSVERNSDCTEVIHDAQKDTCPPVEQTGDEPLSALHKVIEAEESLLISDGALMDITLIAQDPLGHVQPEELPSLPKERQPALLPLPTATAAAPVLVGQLSSSHAPGGHTWRRGTSSSSSPINNAKVFRSTRSFGGIIQSAGRSKGAQSAGYVRKGNSLVRAPGAAVLSSSDDVKAVSVMPRQARPLAIKPPTMKPVFRNTSIARPLTLKPFFSTSRKYLAPFIENDAALASSVLLANSRKIPTSNNDLGRSQSSQSATMKIPLRSLLQEPDPQVNPSTLLVPRQEQQIGLTSTPDLSVCERPDDRPDAAGVCRSVDRTASSRSMDLMSLTGKPASRILETPASTKRLYVRRNANQLVASAQTSNPLSVDTDSKQANKSGVSLAHYFKRNTNQLVRSMSGKGSLARNVVQFSLGRGLSNMADGQGSASTSVSKKTRRGRGVRLMKYSPGPSSWVWTLNTADVGHANNTSAENRRPGPLLFPWKRQNSLRTRVRPQRLRPLPDVKKGSFLFLMSKRFRNVRPVQPLYTRSADGFSLRRSGVLSVGGRNLKWTKSLEKQAKQASEEVTKAAAEAERKKREEKEAVVEAAAEAKDEKRAFRKAARGEGERIVWVGLVRYKMDAASKTLQRVQDSQGEAGNTIDGSSTGWAMTSPLLTPRRSIIGGSVYLRVGNGNQLVRDPKTASRALASEKVRWSLHNARSRGAKKQQYCLFFTKFGKCNKESGKCSYIHDSEKVAVCTKFLKGNCTDVQCLLTHKVIPERMPDCSFFLEGLCTNENCPYRHVNVNPKASYCDGFLRGYCKDGDKCNKKHTYVCSTYAETGDCPDRSTCKFHHPKKKVKVDETVSGHKIGAKRKQRYFSTVVERQPVRRKSDIRIRDRISTVVENGQTTFEGSVEFISLSNIESDEDQSAMTPSEAWPESGATFTTKEVALSDEMEKWIKPTFLLQTTSSTAVAH